MTEQEDEELLSDLNAAKKNVIIYESPAYIKSGKMRDYQVRFLNQVWSRDFN